jgi:hypothetical protein
VLNACAKLFIKDGEAGLDFLIAITLVAMNIGNIEVKIKHIYFSTFFGHLCVLDWAEEEKNLERGSEEILIMFVSLSGFMILEERCCTYGTG